MEIVVIIVGVAAAIYVLWRLFVWNTRRRILAAFSQLLAHAERSLVEMEPLAQQASPDETRHSALVLEREFCVGLAHLARKISITTRTPIEAANWAMVAATLEQGVPGLYEVEPALRSLGQPHAASLAIRVADRLAALQGEGDPP